MKNEQKFNPKKQLLQLKKQLLTNTVTEYTKLLSDKALKETWEYIIKDNIVDDIVPVFDVVSQEIEYRESNNAKTYKKHK